ncbi:MAG: Maf family protein [Phycisphaerae bacterium]|nr:Maf family protein [Phycisphaerae bacterium]
MITNTRPIVLASSSPRRRQLLAESGVAFSVRAPTIAEPDEAFHGLSPSQQAEALAYFKARTIADDPRSEGLILGADTIVAVGEAVLGKPADEADARRMLGMLSGTRHQVVTGVALLDVGRGRLIASDVTHVRMKPLSPGDIDTYIATMEWQGKAGAYAIQETADRYIESIEGSWSNVVGLPMELLARMLQEIQHV